MSAVLCVVTLDSCERDSIFLRDIVGIGTAVGRYVWLDQQRVVVFFRRELDFVRRQRIGFGRFGQADLVIREALLQMIDIQEGVVEVDVVYDSLCIGR